jgi:hypothetical protein
MEENKIIEKKPSKAPVVILIVVLFLIAVAGSSFGGYYFGSTTNNNNGTPSIEKKELKESDVSDFLKRINAMNSSLCTSFPINDVKSLPTQSVLSIGLGEVFGTYSISSDYIENYIKYVIGDNISIKNEDYLCKLDKIAFYKYENGYYVYNQEHPGHGGGGGYIVKTFFKDAYIEKDTVTINTNLLYEVTGDVMGPTSRYYDGVGEDKKIVLDEVDRDNIKAEYEKIKDTLPITTYTFKRSELGGYNLESVNIK